MNGQHQTTILVFRLRAEAAQKRIREIAADTGKVILGNHARERMELRDVSDIEVYRILQRGFVSGEPTLTEQKEWKCKVVLKLKGTREVGVITIILHEGLLFVKTVEWEDLRS